MTTRDNTIRKIRNWLALGTAALSTGVAPLNVNAQENTSPQFNVRGRIERTEPQNPSGDLTKLTLGIAPDNGKNGENFRLYDYQGSGIHYLTAGIKTPTFDITGLTNSTTLFASTGTREGIGIRPITAFSDFKLDLSAEQDRTTAGKSSRLGIGLEYHPSKFTYTLGFDSVNTPKGRINSPMASIMWDISKNDQAGLGFKIQESEKDTLNSVAGYYFHWGKDATWGTRSSVKYNWNEKTDQKNITWQTILFTGEPTFIPIAGPLAIGRGYGYWFNSDVSENPTDTIERVYIGKRTKGGFAFQSDGSITEKAGSQLGSIRNALAYTIPITSGIISPGVYHNYSFNSQTDANTLGASILARIPLTKKTTLEAEVSAGKGVSGTASKMEYYGGIQITRKF